MIEAESVPLHSNQWDYAIDLSRSVCFKIKTNGHRKAAQQ